MTDNLLFDNMSMLLNKKQIIQTSMSANAEKIRELQEQLNALQDNHGHLRRQIYSVDVEIREEEERARLEK
jgi:SMC interacting uncharacterized protein involved in chromosome segregation